MTVKRLQEFGESIFTEITQLANKHSAINLGQGFPDEDGPVAMLEAAAHEIFSGNNQYAPAKGFPQLREAVARDRSLRGHRVLPQDVLITVGATEAISASILGLVEPGSEVIVLEPFYDAYAAAIALAGAKRVPVPLTFVDGAWRPDKRRLEQAITPRTAMIIINSPHNPTGTVFDEHTLRDIADVAIQNDLLVLADEVYERLVFSPATHIPIATLPGMAEHTITVSSAAKTFNATGWKTGWALAPQPLLTAIAAAKQFLTFVGVSPMQPAVAYALAHEQQWIANLTDTLKEKRDYLATVLTDCGFTVYPTGGTYYVVADIRQIEDKLGVHGAQEFCRVLPEKIGVAAIPVSAFTDHPSGWDHLVRFAFCKKWSILSAAAQKLNALSQT